MAKIRKAMTRVLVKWLQRPGSVQDPTAEGRMLSVCSQQIKQKAQTEPQLEERRGIWESHCLISRKQCISNESEKWLRQRKGRKSKKPDTYRQSLNDWSAWAPHGGGKGLVCVCFFHTPPFDCRIRASLNTYVSVPSRNQKAVTQNLMLMVASVVYSMLSSWLPVSGKT